MATAHNPPVAGLRILLLARDTANDNPLFACKRPSDVMFPTPTDNETLPLRRADFDTLTEALDYAARGATGVNIWTARGALQERLPFATIRERAIDFARRLNGLGIDRGERILIVADTWGGFADAFFGAQYAGLLPVPVAVPAGLGGKEAFVEQVKRQLATAAARVAIAPDEMAEFLAESAQGFEMRYCGTISGFASLPMSMEPLQPLHVTESSYIQFSSGSTRFPLGVDISQRALLANIRGISTFGLDVRRDDRATSWLPLYHDMGLIGFLLVPMCNQRSVDLLSPRDFARRPMQWLKLISDHRATATYSPSFGYELVSRRAQAAQIAELDLSCLRIAGIGADMIQPVVLRRFAEVFATAGFTDTAFLPSYGMAETCVALTFAPRGSGAIVDTVDRKPLADEAVAHACRPDAPPSESRELVLCGRPLPDHQIEIRDTDGSVLGPRRVGRIFARGPSVMTGYFSAPVATRSVLSEDGWLDSGDLGYFVDGQIVITGRAKDLIIVNGRNIWPQDIEWAIERLPGVRRGDAAAFALESDEATEKIVVLVVARETDTARREELRREVAGLVKLTVGVDAMVQLVSPAIGLPQTSSGKLSRSRAREYFLAGRFAT